MEHVLYAQGIDPLRSFEPFATLRKPASQLVAVERTAGLLEPAARVSEMTLVGMQPNCDLWVACEPV